MVHTIASVQTDRILFVYLSQCQLTASFVFSRVGENWQWLSQCKLTASFVFSRICENWQWLSQCKLTASFVFM